MGTKYCQKKTRLIKVGCWAEGIFQYFCLLSFKDIFMVCNLGNELIIHIYQLHTKSIFLVITRKIDHQKDRFSMEPIDTYYQLILSIVYFVCSFIIFHFYTISSSLLYLFRIFEKSFIQMGKLSGVFRTQWKISDGTFYENF